MQSDRLDEADESPDWNDGEDADGPETIFCPQCGAETDDESIVCPICQGPLRPKRVLSRPFFLAIVLILIVLFLWPFLGRLF
jgi:uncharacterized paraquat-inducible protein A